MKCFFFFPNFLLHSTLQQPQGTVARSKLPLRYSKLKDCATFHNPELNRLLFNLYIAQLFSRNQFQIV